MALARDLANDCLQHLYYLLRARVCTYVYVYINIYIYVYLQIYVFKLFEFVCIALYFDIRMYV